MKNILCAAVIFVLLLSCNAKSVSKSELFDVDLIQLCVDSTINLDKGLNTSYYLIDFSKTGLISDKSIKTFLFYNKNVAVTNLDSLFKNDSTWIRGGYFNNTVIRIDKIEKRGSDTIFVKTSKYKASDGAIGTEIILKQTSDGYKCVSSGITWIS